MRNLLAIFLTVGLFPSCAIFATEIDPEAEMKFERLKGVGVSITYPVNIAKKYGQEFLDKPKHWGQ